MSSGLDSIRPITRMDNAMAVNGSQKLNLAPLDAAPRRNPETGSWSKESGSGGQLGKLQLDPSFKSVPRER
jgi:hypothetical protein